MTGRSFASSESVICSPSVLGRVKSGATTDGLPAGSSVGVGDADWPLATVAVGSDDVVGCAWVVGAGVDVGASRVDVGCCAGGSASSLPQASTASISKDAAEAMTWNLLGTRMFSNFIPVAGLSV